MGNAELVKPYVKGRQVLIVTNTTVAPLYLSACKKAFAEFDVEAVVLPDGEKYKTLETLNLVFDALIGKRFDRSCTLIALGGGVIGDMTGFSAACFQRGVKFIQMPTTLLSQVDSSVGGKTGVNHPLGKNMIGAFHQPECVVIDTDTLNTLEDRQLSAGLAEVIKYGLIQDLEFFEWLEKHGAEVLEPQRKAIAYAVKVSCQHKAAIVAEDEREGGKRALLNLGHTFGHALEAETGFSETLLHGEAVAIGMVMAFQLSTQLGLCDEADTQRVIAHLRGVGLPTQLSDIIGVKWQADALLAHMAKDKKVSDGKLTFILARGIGKAFITREVATDDLANLLEACAKM